MLGPYCCPSGSRMSSTRSFTIGAVVVAISAAAAAIVFMLMESKLKVKSPKDRQEENKKWQDAALKEEGGRQKSQLAVKSGHSVATEELLELKRLYQAKAEYSDTLTASVVPFHCLQPNGKELWRLGLKPGYDWTDVKVGMKKLEEEDPSARMVYLVRHGEGIHNVAERELGSERWETVEALSDKYFDAPLNNVGIDQCVDLNKAVVNAMQDGMKVDVIIVSPLTRAIETAKYGFASIWGKVPVFAVEMARERFGKNKCDKRKPITQLKSEFPEVNFDLFMESEQDSWFTTKREDDEAISKRIAYFYNWLIQSQWKNVAIIGHSSYMAHSIQNLGAPYHWPANCELVPLVVRKS
mmetsp:Transcript_17600/g.38520  ORF Transcript_17600/g.38520 Transcript_17600/m.38520 type:complete len:354 (-) Transcript_17600:36-1097(-)